MPRNYGGKVWFWTRCRRITNALLDDFDESTGSYLSRLQAIQFETLDPMAEKSLRLDVLSKRLGSLASQARATSTRKT
jgi:hypothetical protein